MPDAFDPIRAHSSRPWLVPGLLLGSVLLLGLYFGARGLLTRHPGAAASVAASSITKPNGGWVAELTMDGRYWYPATDGDTPGPHRHGVLFFSLQTSDSFLDHHSGPGTLRIVGEGISRPITAFGWPQNPDGSLEFSINSSPTVIDTNLKCEVEGSTITCTSTEALKSRLTIHPGTSADADALLQQITLRAATEPELKPLPKTHQVVLCSDADQEVTKTIEDDAAYTKAHLPGASLNLKSARSRKPPPCHSYNDQN